MRSWESLAGPEQKEKNALIARLQPEVVKPGNLENGKKAYTANCAGCHQYKNEGRNLAPNLNGMGAHGPADLLVHIVDPNRVVEPNFISTRIETKGGDSYDGIIDRENASETAARRRATTPSAPPTSRAAPPPAVRSCPRDSRASAPRPCDLLTYLCADDNKFRILDLGGAFTANNSRGLYLSPENQGETVRFNRYGLRRIERTFRST